MLKIIRFREIWIRCYTRQINTQKLCVPNIGTDLQKAIEKVSRIRPSNQPPKVWQLQIEKVDKDGKLIKFTIQEIPEDRYEDAIQYIRAKRSFIHTRYQGWEITRYL
ncbi:PREDICTED: uncharacterized protein LOC105458098 [Wasmannia auropunctata]|uniref:uncharacterized protein LOC105458098 n=1 Tax=Wasmannia auropunctata TaxID=64793 RepID=UPI0005ED5782|nr:PREDICTED: uncharacterized protein LOC105458098 [Wasmannia auropunctata]